MTKYLLIIATSLLFISCGGGGSSSTAIIGGSVTPSTNDFEVNVSAYDEPDESKIPKLSMGEAIPWNIQLDDQTNAINENYTVGMYEVDLFETDASLISSLKTKGAIVICYFNGGAWEEWTEDADDFPEEVKGNDMDGWPGEKWLDITNGALKDIMEARLQLAVDKGCDGVDPDNMNGFLADNNTGFDLTADNQLAYNRYMANAAREKGLSVALKNDLEQIADLVNYFDFAVNEECFEHEECDELAPFIDAGRAVFNIEYADKYINNTNGARDTMCDESTNTRKFSTLIMPYELDGSSRDACIN